MRREFCFRNVKLPYCGNYSAAVDKTTEEGRSLLGGCEANYMIISASMLAADFSQLDRELKRAQLGGAQWLHLDIIDGAFAPNNPFGVPVVKSIRKKSSLYFDLHLMIQRPMDYLEVFAEAGADCITFHLESEGDPAEIIDRIRSLGKKVGIAISPGTPAEKLFPYTDQIDLALVMSVEPGFGGQKFLDGSLQKIRALRKAAPGLMVSVDGGINAETAPQAREAGANVLVAGSYVFGAEDVEAAVYSLKCTSAAR